MTPSASFRDVAVRGLRSGVALWLFLARIVIPISLGAAAISALGWLGVAAGWVAPAMKIWGLPGEAALPLLTGGLLSLYGAIGIMSALDLTARQINVLAILLLVSHNLIVETTVQKKSGMRVWEMLTVRLVTAAVLGWMVAAWFPGAPDASAPAAGAAVPPVAYWPASIEWSAAVADFVHRLPGVARTVAIMSVVVFAVAMGQEWARLPRGAAVLGRLASPVLVATGLPRRSAFLVAAGIVFGLMYGSAFLYEEARAGRITRSELFRVNVFLGTTHAWIEDTLIFVAIGASAWWILGLRLLVCLPAVRFWGYLHDRLENRGH